MNDEVRRRASLDVGSNQHLRAFGIGAMGLALALTLLSISKTGSAGCQAERLFSEGQKLTAEERYDDSITVTLRSLACAETIYDPFHENMAFIYDALAFAHLKLNRLPEAHAYGKRAVAIIRSAKPDSLDHAKLATNLASVHSARGHHRDAKPLFQTAYDIFRSKSSTDPGLLAITVRSLAITEAELSRHQSSLDLYAEVARLIEDTEGPQSSAFGRALLDRAGAHLMLDQPDEAQSDATRAKELISPDVEAADLVLAKVALQRSSLDEAEGLLKGIINRETDDHVLTASALYNLAFVNILRGRFLEAEPILKRTLSVQREFIGERHAAIGRTLHSLAIVYNRIGQYDISAKFYLRALQLFEEAFGKHDLTVAATKVEYAQLLQDQGDLIAAEDEVRHALVIYTGNSSTRPIYEGYALSSLGSILHTQGNLIDAAEAFEQARKVMEAERGVRSSDLPPVLIELGNIRRKQRDFETAEGLISRAIDIREHDASLTPWGHSRPVAAMAELRHAQGKSDEALTLLEKAIKTISDRFGRLGELSRVNLEHGEAMSERRIFELYLDVAYALHLQGHADAKKAIFRGAQYLNFTDTAVAISRMSARLANQGQDSNSLMRERQDAVETWRTHYFRSTEAMSSALQNEHLETSTDVLASTDRRIQELDAELINRHPNFEELLRPRPATAPRIKALLKPHEALLMQVTGEDTTHLIWLEQDHIAVEQTTLGRRELALRVQNLLDGVKTSTNRVRDLAPFDVDSAHRLYQALIAPFAERLARAKHLIVVLDGPARQLPLSLLLRTEATEAPGAYGRFREKATRQSLTPFQTLDYLGKHVAISTLPSAGSLAKLRSDRNAASNAQDRHPFIGFGSPAFEREGSGNRITNTKQPSEKANLLFLRQLSRDLPPLPEAETELLELAKLLRADRADVKLGDEASETAVEAAGLGQYKTIVFATHAMAPGQLHGSITESALILPVTEHADLRHDGILTESEIALLELNADWVILSACNTAAPPGRSGTEALPGLARAFFLAGSRALLVCHWDVDSAAASALMTGTMRALQENGEVGRAVALQTAMKELIEDPEKAEYSHPHFWASFAIVGEGFL